MYSLTKVDAIDFNIFIPNALGLIFNIIQSGVWYKYYKKNQGETSLEKNLVDREDA